MLLLKKSQIYSTGRTHTHTHDTHTNHTHQPHTHTGTSASARTLTHTGPHNNATDGDAWMTSESKAWKTLLSDGDWLRKKNGKKKNRRLLWFHGVTTAKETQGDPMIHDSRRD